MKRRILIATLLLGGCYPPAYLPGHTDKAEAHPTPSFPVAWNGESTPGAGSGPSAIARAAEAPAPLAVVVTPPAAVVPPPAAVVPPPPAISPAVASKKEAFDLGVVAVMPVNAKEAQIDSATLLAFEEGVRTVTGDVLTPRGYTVLTGETTLAVLSDNGVDPSKVCEAQCSLQAARELKAKLFIAATVAKTEGAFVAFVRLFENTRGKQVGSVELDGNSVRDLRKQFSEKAPQFFARVLDDSAQ